MSEDLRSEEPEVLATLAGMRPSREGGARVEREQRLVNGQDCVLVHNYGAGGTGFQAGYGMAIEAVQYVKDVLAKLDSARPTPRL